MRVPTPEEIKALRKQLGLSQEALAEKLGVSFSTVNRWERGHRAPTKLALLRLEALARGRSSVLDVPWIEEAVAALDQHRFGVALRDRVLVVTGATPDLEEADVLEIEPALGPLRSLRQVSVRGAPVLIAGARDGVWLMPWLGNDGSSIRFPFGSRSGEKLGVNSLLVAHGCLYATHSERGLVRWQLGHPANAERVHVAAWEGAKTIRCLTRLDADRFLFAADDRVLVSIRGEGDANLLFQEPHGESITALSLHEHTLFVGTKAGSLYAFDLVFRRSQPLLAHEKSTINSLSMMKRDCEAYLVIGSRNREVSLLNLDGVHDRLLFSSGRILLKSAVASPSQVAAVDARQERLFLWPLESPSNAPAVLSVHEELGQHVQDLCLLRMPEVVA